MTLKERLHTSIETLGHEELMMVYEHVHLLQQIRQKVLQHKSDMALDRILHMTQSSTGNWSDSVRQEREERG